MRWWRKPAIRDRSKDDPISDSDVAELKEALEKALKTREPSVYRVPAFAPRRTYGGVSTTSRTGTIDVVLDDKGDVKQVWFRCMELPFTVDRRDHDPGYYNPGDLGLGTERKIAIEEITYADLFTIEEITHADLPSEESSQ